MRDGILILFNGGTLITVLGVAYKFGQFLQRFSDVEKLVALHEKQLAPRRKVEFET